MKDYRDAVLVSAYAQVASWANALEVAGESERRLVVNPGQPPSELVVRAERSIEFVAATPSADALRHKLATGTRACAHVREHLGRPNGDTELVSLAFKDMKRMFVMFTTLYSAGILNEYSPAGATMAEQSVGLAKPHLN